MKWLDYSLPSVEEVALRLSEIYTREIDVNGYITRDIGARTIFVMLYSFCFDGENWIRPATITCMTDKQSKMLGKKDRLRWLTCIQSKKAPRNIPGRWYMPNTRESIRDESIRELKRLNAIIEREELPKTSSRPRYTLKHSFAELFNPSLTGEFLKEAIKKWQKENLTAGALARLELAKRMVTEGSSGILIQLPSGETRKFSSGPSSDLTKAVVEEFSKKFLKKPAALMISESGQKIVLRDHQLCSAIRFEIDVSSTLPDVILADLDCVTPLIVFVECVATDGPISDRRKEELNHLIDLADYNRNDCVFVTAFKDRTDPASRKLIHTVAWGTFIWYATEPNNIIYLYNGVVSKGEYLVDFL